MKILEKIINQSVAKTLLGILILHSILSIPVALYISIEINKASSDLFLIIPTFLSFLLALIFYAIPLSPIYFSFLSFILFWLIEKI